MRAVLALVALATLARARHALYRAALGAGDGGAGGARRVLGGRAAAVEEWGAVCALLDRYWRARCSGALLAPRWALTAAHCASARVAYVAYDARAPRRPPARAAPVQLLYRHPGYRVLERDDGAGPDVALLRHDVALVRTRADMAPRAPPRPPPLASLALHDAAALRGEPVDVLGYGAGGAGGELRRARLALVACARAGWAGCECGAGAARAVCAGDSGGPVLYRGALLALTSMGPVECAAPAAPGPLLSVFTPLRPYAELLNATMRDADAALAESRAPRYPAPGAPALLLAAGARLRRHIARP